MASTPSVARRGGVAGIIFLALLVAQTVWAGEPPDPGAPPVTIATWLADHRTQVLGGSYLIVLATVVFLFFVVSLCRRLEVAGADPGLTMVARLAAVLNGASYVVLSAVQVGNAFLVPQSNADVERALNAVVFVGGNLACVPSGVFLLAIGWAARTSAAPRWLVWSSLVLSALQFLAGFGFARQGAFSPTGPVVLFGGLILFFVWTLAASVHLLRQPVQVESA
jgi:hypothetical protein